MKYAITAIAAFVICAVMLIYAHPQEDSIFFNCYLHGNQRCGDEPGFVGFTYLG